MFNKKNFFLALITVSFVAHANYTIFTTSGITEGQINNKVISWHDIPYAQPPIGILGGRRQKK